MPTGDVLIKFPLTLIARLYTNLVTEYSVCYMIVSWCERCQVVHCVDHCDIRNCLLVPDLDSEPYTDSTTRSDTLGQQWNWAYDAIEIGMGKRLGRLHTLRKILIYQVKSLVLKQYSK